MATKEAVRFLVCLESGSDPASLQDAIEHLEPWSAERCTGQSWIVAAPVTPRAIFDGLASRIGDEDRLLVAEISDVLWYNLPDRSGQTGGWQNLIE